MRKIPTKIINSPLTNCAKWCVQLGPIHFDKKTEIHKILSFGEGEDESIQVKGLLDLARLELIEIIEFNEGLGVKF